MLLPQRTIPISANPNEVPYYTPCLYAVIHEKLKVEGLNMPLSLLANLHLLSICTYSRDDALGTRQVSIWEARKLLGYERYSYYLGLHEEFAAYQDIEIGLASLIAQLESGRTALVSGTTYFLPYSPDFHSSKYLRNYPNPLMFVSNHWLMINGMAQHDLTVYDPIPHKFIGTLSLDFFRQFWLGNKPIPQFNHLAGINDLFVYGYLDLMYKRRIEQAAIDGLVQSALVTAARTYLEGGTFRDGNEVRYCGATADKQLLDDIEAEVADVPKDLLNQYTKCVFDMRFGRYFQRDLLAALVCVQPERFNRHLASFERVVQAWEQAGKMMSLFNQRNKLDKAATSRIIHALRANVWQETEVQAALSYSLHDVASLPRTTEKH